MAYHDGEVAIMFSTTLRIADDIATFLQQAAKEEGMSVNAYLARLLERERLAARKRRLAADWAAYAADQEAQDVEFALDGQADVAAERTIPYRSGNRSGKSR
jgi:predicted transcriptional regulator